MLYGVRGNTFHCSVSAPFKNRLGLPYTNKQVHSQCKSTCQKPLTPRRSRLVPLSHPISTQHSNSVLVPLSEQQHPKNRRTELFGQIMDLQRLLGLLLLLWMGVGVDGEDTISFFLQDVITTFRLVSPTIVYNADEEAPEICYTNQWLLCLPHFSNETNKRNNERNSSEPNNTKAESATDEGKNSTFLDNCTIFTCGEAPWVRPPRHS